MAMTTNFDAGDPVVWRSLPWDVGVGYVFSGRVLVDDRHIQAIVQPPASATARRNGRRGPRNWMLPGAWDGTHTIGEWRGPLSVRLHPVGRHYSVIRAWDSHHGRFAGWYINLERPWTRVSVGFDSADLILDVTVSDDMTAWALKDEDQLDWARAVGRISPAEHDAAHAIALEAIADLEAGRPPFVEDAWPAVPRECLQPVTYLPVGWNCR